MLNHAKAEYYTRQTTAPDLEIDDERTLETVRLVALAAEDRKAEEITVLKVSEISYLADYFVIVTGFSTVQVRAIYQAIAKQVEQDTQRVPLSIEGQREGTWILIDYGDVIVHIMLPEEREFYSLEAFWGHAERIDVLTLL
ncbi:ribosome silencing factor [Limnoraphis robusta]|uniref:Ribosomal silencing factor RsfS n=1 Tax=Limnoraphis robusta CS-951 TaxID=1637645 RepID=A0A0F5YKQ0_9CYAN|nr:ribosome silencing factor [Limnoraphis robusta]KKD39227.1 ribosome-associated protein IOJAP [Limnoraphis robusta CS-951]